MNKPISRETKILAESIIEGFIIDGYHPDEVLWMICQARKTLDAYKQLITPKRKRKNEPSKI